MIIAFRASVPATTPATNPLEIELNPQARAIQEIVVWSSSANMAINKSGYRLLDYNASKVFVPGQGSNDNNIMTASGESGWAAIPSFPVSLDMNEQLIEGPPYRLKLQFYNTDAALITVAGYFVVSEPSVKIEPAMLYEILTIANPRLVEAGAPDQTFEKSVSGHAAPRNKKKVSLPGK